MVDTSCRVPLGQVSDDSIGVVREGAVVVADACTCISDQHGALRHNPTVVFQRYYNGAFRAVHAAKTDQECSSPDGSISNSDIRNSALSVIDDTLVG
jgi:hypothetical protein